MIVFVPSALISGLLVFDWKKGEPIGMLVIAPSDARREEEHRDAHEHEAHEHLQNQDFHKALLGERANVVARTTVIELAGIAIAHTSGESRPAYARPTVTTL